MNKEDTVGLLIDLYEGGDARQAVAAADAVYSAGDPISQISPICASIYTDRGGELLDAIAVGKGIEIFKELAEYPGCSPEDRNRARYNLSNGYGALAKYHEAAGDLDSRMTAWRGQRDELQAILLDRPNQPLDILPEILTNFGNSLSQLGRKAEALDAYLRALVLRPGHPVAAGCAGQVTLDLVGIQTMHNARLVFRAKELLELSLSDREAIRQAAGPLAEAEYKRSYDQMLDVASKMFAGGAAELERLVAASKRAHSGAEPKGEAADWAEAGLLLTVNPYPEWCGSTVSDDLFFDGLLTDAGPEGEERFTLLAHTLNQIKEEYATSRYALLQSEKLADLGPLSRITQYADTLDYADFGLSPGLLKMSMRLSIDLLDKVAVFLDRYLELGLPARRVSFATVWYEKADAQKGEGAELGKHLAANTFLRGIRDVAETLNVYPAPSKDIRNKATHDFVIIENMTSPQVRLGGKVVTGDAREFSRHLLRISRGVLINLMAFVQRNEALKKQASTKTSAPMTFRYAQGISDELGGFGHG